MPKNKTRKVREGDELHNLVNTRMNRVNQLRIISTRNNILYVIIRTKLSYEYTYFNKYTLKRLLHQYHGVHYPQKEFYSLPFHCI